MRNEAREDGILGNLHCVKGDSRVYIQVCLNLNPECRESYGTTASLPRTRRSPEQHTCATDRAGQEPQQAPGAHGPPATASPGTFTSRSAQPSYAVGVISGLVRQTRKARPREAASLVQGHTGLGGRTGIHTGAGVDSEGKVHPGLKHNVPEKTLSEGSPTETSWTSQKHGQ